MGEVLRLQQSTAGHGVDVGQLRLTVQVLQRYCGSWESMITAAGLLAMCATCEVMMVGTEETCSCCQCCNSSRAR